MVGVKIKRPNNYKVLGEDSGHHAADMVLLHSRDCGLSLFIFMSPVSADHSLHLNTWFSFLSRHTVEIHFLTPLWLDGALLTNSEL